ncbi:hypothetical protein ACSBOB_10210 [Mesorhizobium sp. ASY16-5R]|uniref:hypothetical protein n=1 Tax=Mesorhizobium sp. ASY16-5R TaxID=3445772 RepID=UPI003F9FE779
MSAIVPLNVAAIRVSGIDQSNVTPTFKGRTAAFDLLPHTASSRVASTGDTVVRPLADNTATDRLGAGIHLHWELPDRFKRGVQGPADGRITFPAAPNRWLVIRSLSLYDPATKTWGAVTQTGWIVESDFVSATPTAGPRGEDRYPIAIPVGIGTTPFSYMGRVLNAAGWDPAKENPADYLPHYKGPGGEALYLTCIGFVGAAFSSYYPDCRSVFGFWDDFGDKKEVADAITGSTQLRFRASYQVVGWLSDPTLDPLAGMAATVTKNYATYLAQTVAEKVPVKRTPADIFVTLAGQQLGWTFDPAAIDYTLGKNDVLVSLDAPQTSIVSGIVQEIDWNQLVPGTDTPFLTAPGGGTSWSDEVDLAIGNTTTEAISALVRSQLPTPAGSGIDADYEFLLDALQLGILRDIEEGGNTVTGLVESLHTRAFAQQSGGQLWSISARTQPSADGQPPTQPVEVTLPLPLAQKLETLNLAQQAYDQGRDRLATLRRQLFMDWVIFVKQYVRGNTPQPVVSTNDLSAFLATSTGGELGAVLAEQTAVGLAAFPLDAEGRQVIGVTTTDTGDTAATRLVAAFKAVQAALQQVNSAAAAAVTTINAARRPGAVPPPPEWLLEATSAAPYWLPTDTVVAMEGDRIEPVRRNGATSAIAVRTSAQIIDQLTLAAGGGSWTVTGAQLAGLMSLPAAAPDVATLGALAAEAALLMPMAAPLVATALAAQGGAGNPAVADATAFATALATAQGGAAPLSGAPASGLYAAVRATGYKPVADPVQNVTAPIALDVTFTTAKGGAFPPDPVGWHTPTLLPEFTPTRVDPFLPVWLVWSASIDPLAYGQGTDYAPTTISDRFILDADAVDYRYRLGSGAPVPGFTTGKPVTYAGAVVLNKRPTEGLTTQIDAYIADYPPDPTNPADTVDAELKAARADLAGRRIMSQALSGLSMQQTLQTPMPQIEVANLVAGPRDAVTGAIARAARATANDTWYATAFNSVAPISTGVLADYNYGPVRSGFMEVQSLTIVDVFGQVMTLETKPTASGAMSVAPSADFRPEPGDSANAEKIYLPPRPLVPTRLDFHWLSATQNMVLMNDHPATSPVCGWILPNHLDVTLVFYQSDGSAVGSFGIEHGQRKYRTRAGNMANPTDNLALDVGPVGKPSVNPHLADLMWFIAGETAGFLDDLMTTIQATDAYIAPASYAQDVSLSILMGRALAITRAVLGLSTAGGALPISQANISTSGPLAQAVANGWTDYATRQAHTSAGLANMIFPLRLGDLSDIDDGLVAFLPEGPAGKPYSTVYSSAAPKAGANDVKQPLPDTMQLKLNAGLTPVTLIVDPRSPVHATTGILPVGVAQIPPDQYAAALEGLSLTFVTHPVLVRSGGLSLPLPDESGFSWSWIAPGQAPTPLPADTASDLAVWGYSPQHLAEGWLGLVPQPKTGGRS